MASTGPGLRTRPVEVPLLERAGLRLSVDPVLLRRSAGTGPDRGEPAADDLAPVLTAARAAAALAAAQARLDGGTGPGPRTGPGSGTVSLPRVRLLVTAGSGTFDVRAEADGSTVRVSPDVLPAAEPAVAVTALLTAALLHRGTDDPARDRVRVLAALVCTESADADRAALAGRLGVAGLPLADQLEADSLALLWLLAHPDPAVTTRAARRVGVGIGSPQVLPRLARLARTVPDGALRQVLAEAHHRIGRRTLVTHHPSAAGAVKRSTYRGRYRELDDLVTDLVVLLDADSSGAPAHHLGVDLARWRAGAGEPVRLLDEAVSDGRTTEELWRALRAASPGRAVEVVGRDVNLEFTEVWDGPDAVGLVDGGGRCVWQRALPGRSEPAADLERRWAATPAEERRRHTFHWLDPSIPEPGEGAGAGPAVRLSFAGHDLFGAAPAGLVDIVRVCGLLYERLRPDADAESYFSAAALRTGVAAAGRQLRDGGVLVVANVIDSADDSRTYTDVDVFQRVDRPVPRLVRVHRLGLGLGPAVGVSLPLDESRPLDVRPPPAGDDPAPGRSDVAPADAVAFEPWPDRQVHVEWGLIGARQAAARGDDVVIVDVLSFSTTVTVAAERGIDCLVYSGGELTERGGREAVAAELGAVAATGKRSAGPGRFSLSPASLLGITGVRTALFTSLNGALAVSATAGSPFVAIGCLRNRSATAELIAGRLAADPDRRVSLVACGEHWSSVVPDEEGLRPCVEDLLGAGAIAADLARRGLRVSAEATAAAAVFTALGGLPDDLVSSRELIAAGFGDDVRIAAQLDVTAIVPVRSADDPTGRRFVPAEVA